MSSKELTSNQLSWASQYQQKRACTKTQNNETKRPKRNHRNERNERNETTETTETSETTVTSETAETKPPKRPKRAKINEKLKLMIRPLSCTNYRSTRVTS